jgi:hypothetical protein
MRNCAYLLCSSGILLSQVLFALAGSNNDDQSYRYNVHNAPYINKGHEVQFFVLENSFPYNAPPSIK